MSVSAQIEDLALQAATEYLSKGTQLNTSIAKLAQFNQLSQEKIARVVERANRIVYLRLYKGNEDKTFSFPLASTDYICGVLRGTPAVREDSLYNVDSLRLKEPAGTKPVVESFYDPGQIRDPEAPTPVKEEVKTVEITLPKGVDRIYLNITDAGVTPNKVAVAQLVSRMKEADEQIKTASFFTGNRLASIKELFMKLVRAGSSIKDVLAGVFSKLPIRLKKKAIPVVQNIVDDLHRTGKIMQKPDVNTSILKFGSYQEAPEMTKIAEELEGILKEAQTYQSAVIKKAENYITLEKLAEIFPELNPLLRGDSDV